jgi:hypothetical protein
LRLRLTHQRLRPNRFTIRPCCGAEKRSATWCRDSARSPTWSRCSPPRPYPGNPRPPAAFPEVKIGKVQPEPATVYNPPDSSYALFFDDNDKLVLIEDAHSPMAGLGPKAVHQRYPELKGTGHDERVIELQGQIEPCIVMMVLFSASTRKVTKVAYAFTCPTSGSQSTRRDDIPPY